MKSLLHMVAGTGTATVTHEQNINVEPIKSGNILYQ